MSLRDLPAFLVLLLALAALPAAAAAPPAPGPAPRRLTLEAAVRTALRQSPLLAAVVHERRAAGEERRAALGRMLPQVTAYADARRQSDPTVVVPIKSFNGPLPDFSRDQYQAGTRIRAPLFHGGSLRARLAQAAAGDRAALEGLRLTAQRLVAEVTDAFNRVLYLEALVRAQEETLSALEKARADAALRLEVGRIAPVELMRIDTQVASQRQALIQSRESALRAREDLALLLGLDPSAPPEAEGRLLPAPPAGEAAPDIEAALARRPDVRQAERRVRQAEAALRAARGRRLPALDLVGDYGRRAGSGFEADEEVWWAGVALSFDLFTGGTVSAEIRKAEDQLRAAEERLREARLRARTDILHARSARREAEHRLEVAAAARRTAEETYRIEQLRYRTGAGTVTDSLLAQSAWLQAKAAELAAIFDHQRAAVAERLALGLIEAGPPATAAGDGETPERTASR
ncbi:TolC family protein [Dissulfurirhabdus thermomarina]|uniref:TolC family protein n=1 Tax=Dissulfurirhabdus thermomarina TaxID=1765737 RepID=A0A6N9TVC1_DISTH|nr:TolC family protein [Dissulfurirhabdus thermomarina]NDY43377.1 TolC family protein [Dissulfurirhabdus thermomarina]NMX23802.1 TolC family protein [Dissulfurirhabdus thermomarina]